MTWWLAAGCAAAALLAQHMWLRPRLARRLHRMLIPPLRRRLRCVRRSLDALDRATSFRPYRGHHTPSRRTQP